MPDDSLVGKVGKTTAGGTTNVDMANGLLKWTSSQYIGGHDPNSEPHMHVQADDAVDKG
jgi:ABC-type uncharacterized transport system ATPase subunit